MKSNKGITLIGLVVTIIVLLILAGVTAAVALGQDGVIEKANRSKLQKRYATVKEKAIIRDTSLKIGFAKNQEGESQENFVNRLKAEGLLFDGEYDNVNYSTITIGEEEPILLSDGSERGMKIWNLMNTLEELSDNSEKKHLTLTIRVTNPSIPVEMPISNASGITIDWGDGAETQFSTDNPTHTYASAGDYTAKIKGRTEQANATFGKNEWSYKNTNIVKLTYWGENNFQFIHNLGGNLNCTIPEPTRNSFERLKRMYGTFVHTYNLTGSIPENLFVGAPNLTYLGSFFPNCYGLTGPIPENLFINNSLITHFSHLFSECRNLSGSIPEDLFRYCYEARNFCAIFYNCYSLTGNIPQTLFDNCTKANCFGYYNSTTKRGTFAKCTGLTGPAIPLWNKGFTMQNMPQGTYEGCTGLDGYNSIPQDWK